MADFSTVFSSCGGLHCIFLNISYSAKTLNHFCLGDCKTMYEVVAGDAINMVSIMEID